MRYEAERARIEEVRRLQTKREQILTNIGLAEARGDLARIADLKWVKVDWDCLFKVLTVSVTWLCHCLTAFCVDAVDVFVL